MGLLDDRVAIVTGAGRGIGAAVAKRLAAEGAAIIVNDLGGAVDGTGSDNEPADEVVQAIRDAGGTAVANYNDVSNYDAAENIIQSALKEYGKLDVLVNVAGILRDRMIFNMNEDEWDAVIRVHLKGTFNTSKFASIYWRQERQGHYRIINFTSGSGLHGAPGQPNYAAAKMGIAGLTYSCANALNRYGVTANAINPSASTRMTETVPDDRRRVSVSSVDPERSPDNASIPVAYIASTRSDWLNGRVISPIGFRIALYSEPQIISEVASDKPWSVADAADKIERTFMPYCAGPTPYERGMVLVGAAPPESLGQGGGS